MVNNMQPATLNFKYGYANTFRMFASNGAASTTAINLNGEEIPYTNIVETSSRDKRFIVVLAPNTQVGAKTSKHLQNSRFFVLDIVKPKAEELKKHIDLYGSAIWAENHRKQLISTGKGDTFSAATCPHCGATVDMSESERTAYIYCPYCASIVNYNQKIISNGDVYNICDECHMYDRIRGYTVFHFYFLLVVYGYSVKRRFVCDTCATSLAQRTLLLNLVFILGIPSAIYMWIKAQSGRDPYFQDLAKANKLARKGKYQEADEIYDKLFSLYPEHPGLLMNKGLGHLHGSDGNGGIGFLTRSLKACGNYLPTLQIVQRMQQAQPQTNNARLERI
jgi:tetratricopeptide (TPR) repeat protein